MTPKGNLLIIGGAEDLGDEHSTVINYEEYKPFEILTELIHFSKGKGIEIITTASNFQKEVIKRYQEAFHKMGYFDLNFMEISDNLEADNPIYIQRAAKAGVIFFTGGDQFRIKTILGGSLLIDVIKQRYLNDKDFLIAGTSAGAMAISSIMLCGGAVEEVLINKNIKILSGLGFLQQCIIDTHFIKRGRFSRLAHAILIYPDQLGIGLSENTALLIKQGSEAKCIGSSMVIIIDGQNINQTNNNIKEAEESLYAENLIVHILVRGCRYSINDRKFYKPGLIVK